MNINKKTRRQNWMQNVIFYAVFLTAIGFAAYLTAQHKVVMDWTYGGRNTLSEETRAILDSMSEPLIITAYVDELPELRDYINNRVEKFKLAKKDIELEFVNPDLNPTRAQADGVQRAGQMILRYKTRHEIINDVGLKEGNIASVLQRLSRSEDKFIVFVEGNGERNINDPGNQGFQQLAEHAKRSGLAVQNVNFIRTPSIPENTAFLVIASPTDDWDKGAVDMVRDYVAAGGNLLWLIDPSDNLHKLEPLAHDLGLQTIPGIIVDANQQLRQLMGIQHPALIPVVDYAPHAITNNMQLETLFPFARGILLIPPDGWQAQILLQSLAQSWAETAPLEGDGIAFDETSGDQAGPIPLAYAMEQREDDHSQRIVIVGDADFMSNNYLGYAGNLELANGILNWLSKDDALIRITAKRAPDTELNLEENTAITLAVLFMVVMPLGLIITGLVIWLRRRRR